MSIACGPAGLAAAGSNVEAPPEWDLSDLYASPEAPEIEADLERALRDATALEAEAKGRLATLDGAALGGVIERYERIEEQLGRLMSYAQLLHAAKADDPQIGRFYQGIHERVTNIGTKLLFLTLELNRIDDAALAEKLQQSARLARYRPWIRDVRAFRPHQLDDEIERVLHEKSVTGRSAWVRLFDETMASLRFPLDGKELTSSEVFDLLSDRDRSKRQAAAASIASVLTPRVRLFALITNTLAKDKQIEDGWRRFPRPISSRNLANHVEDDVVDALIAAVRDAYPRLSHRYYRLKARWLGLDYLEHWDRNAPVPEDSDKRIAWSDAKVIVLDAYRGFSPRLAAILERFFGRNWIDAALRPGKDAGAFCHPTVPSVHPYVLMNYQGRTRDVMTLAHELGHGVHQVLAARQGPLMASTPLTLAETASVFGEQLTFRSLLAAECDPVQRRVLLAGKIEDALNTVVRQIAFVEFEGRVHDARRQAELTADELGEVWLDVQKESLGPAFRFDEGYRVFWSYIPHFIHVPFYVYAYAFGDCLVNSLWAVYQAEPAGFEERYLELLEAGGTLRHRELLAPFGLDASDPGLLGPRSRHDRGADRSARGRAAGTGRTGTWLTRDMAEWQPENTLGGRVRRYAQVSGTMGGLAARLAGQRLLGIDIDQTRHAEELRMALGGLKGPLMKVAQLLATIPEALPKEYAAQLSQLQSQAPPMGRPFVRRRMASELGPDWRSRFREFDLEAAAAASLGQVHRATSLDGAALACKLQYPNIESAVEADLAQLSLIFSLYRRYDQTINPERIYEELAERLREELDYDREARHMALYAHMLKDEPQVDVPEVLPELSTRRLLTMTWLEGRKLTDFTVAPLEQRNALAYNLFRAWYVPFYDYAVIHGDPHLGNYTASPEMRLNLLDFGCIRVFRPTLVQGVIDLYWALVRGDRDLAVHAYETWGFTDLRKEVIDTLNLWAAFVYAPLMEDRPRLIEETNSGAYGREVAFNVQRGLRKIGGVTPPREFVLMDRAAIGLGSVFLHLRAEINWHQLFMELIEGFDVDALARRQVEALQAQGLPLPG